MRFGTRRMAAIAATSALAWLAAVPLPAALAAPVAARGGARPNAASSVGGPLMASRGIVVNYPSPSAARLPKVPASAYVIANASTGQVLAARDPHGRFGPASTMKVLTAITLIPRLNPDALVPASQLAADTEPNDAGLIAGRKYEVSALFTALLTISANDAAVALTQATGSLSKGMALINAEAHHLQAYDVLAKQPNGLPAPGQVESAYDEALIARQAVGMPAFMRYDSTLAARFEVKPGHWETLDNQNWLLTKYRGGIGGKIGWTVSSEATYIGLARRHGVTLIVTIMHCTPLQEITSAVKLLNWGFAMTGKVRPVGVLVPPLTTAAEGPGARPAGTGAAAGGESKARGSTVRKAAGTAAGGARPLTASIGTQPSGTGNEPVYAIAAGIVVAAGLGAAGLALTRRKVAAGRHRH